MLDPDEIRWVKSTANELNNLLQVITESAQFIERFCGESNDTGKYFGILRNGIDRAARVAATMLDHAALSEDAPAQPALALRVPVPLFPDAAEPRKPEPRAARGRRQDLEPEWRPRVNHDRGR